MSLHLTILTKLNVCSTWWKIKLWTKWKKSQGPIRIFLIKFSTIIRSDQFSKWPLSAMTHYRSDDWWSDPFPKWPFFETTNFRGNRIRSDPVSKWPFLYTTLFRSNRFRSDPFSKWSISKWTILRSDQLSNWILPDRNFVTKFFLKIL